MCKIFFHCILGNSCKTIDRIKLLKVGTTLNYLKGLPTATKTPDKEQQARTFFSLGGSAVSEKQQACVNDDTERIQRQTIP